MDKAKVRPLFGTSPCPDSQQPHGGSGRAGSHPQQPARAPGKLGHWWGGELQELRPLWSLTQGQDWKGRPVCHWGSSLGIATAPKQGGGRTRAWDSAGSLVRNEGLGPQLHETEGGMDSRWAADREGVVVFLNDSYSFCRTV